MKLLLTCTLTVLSCPVLLLTPCEIFSRINTYKFKKGTTTVLKQQVVPIVVEEEIIRRVPAADAEESMDTS